MTAGLVRRRTLTAALSTLIVGVQGCGRAGEDGGERDGAITQFPVGERDGIARIRARLLAGNAFDSRDLDGVVVVYNVWGSWCPPCRVEAPALARVARETAGAGVRFVGINVRDNDAAARAFERAHGITYPSIASDSSGDALLAFGSAAPLSAVPSTLIVDDRGRLATRVIGPLTYPTLRGLVEDVLAGAGPS